MSDEDFLDLLEEIDEDEDITVTSWEASFLESVLFRDPPKGLSQRERKVAKDMIIKYLGGDRLGDD